MQNEIMEIASVQLPHILCTFLLKVEVAIADPCLPQSCLSHWKINQSGECKERRKYVDNL